MADIFLSYAREDLVKAKLLAETLQQQGWSVFWDSTLLAGQDFHDEIEQEIAKAGCMIVAWSTSSRTSQWVKGEATLGHRRKVLVPILFDEVDPPINFIALHTENFVDWRGETDSSSFHKLQLALINILGLKAAGAGDSALTQSIALSNQSLSVKQNVPKRKPNSGTRGANSDEVKLNSGLKGARPIKSKFVEPEMSGLLFGTFQMGDNSFSSDMWVSERPRHFVHVKPFALAKHLVTFDEFDLFAMASAKALPSDENWGRGKRPVINVSWKDASAYAEWLSILSGKRYRLPSEAEWEFAARAGTTTDYYWQGGLLRYLPMWNAHVYAWSDLNSDGKTHPVGEKEPNAFGLYDMSGNVQEMVQDCWNENYDGAPTDGSAWENQSEKPYKERVVKGGSFNHYLLFLRSSYRTSCLEGHGQNNRGFRLAQDLI